MCPAVVTAPSYPLHHHDIIPRASLGLSNARVRWPNSPLYALLTRSMSMASCFVLSRKLLTKVLWTDRAPSRSWQQGRGFRETV